MVNLHCFCSQQFLVLAVIYEQAGIGGVYQPPIEAPGLVVPTGRKTPEEQPGGEHAICSGQYLYSLRETALSAQLLHVSREAPRHDNHPSIAAWEEGCVAT